MTLPSALVAADINHDGNPDLITLRNLYGHSIAVQLGTGNGTFKAPLYSLWAAPSLYYDPTAFAVGDVNGDGTPDIVVAYQDTAPFPTNTPPPSPLTVLLGNGQGSFTAAGTYPVFTLDSTITSLALADVYGNGRLDVVATNKVGTLYVAPNLGGGRFGSVQTYSTPTNISSQVCQVTVGDLNGEGKPDIIVTDPLFNFVSVLLNTGNGAFAPAQAYSVGGAPTAVAIGDFNRDGKLDVVTANSNGTVSVLLNNGNGLFGTAQSFAVAASANSVAVGDFNHDGFLDVVTTGAEMDLLLGNGKGAFVTYQKVGPAGSNVVAADFNRDGFPDLAQIDASSNSNIDVVLNNADWMAGPVSLSFGSITYNSKTNLYSETVTLTNKSSGPLTGPLSLELTNLPSGAVLTDATGRTNGNPYIRLLSSGKALKQGASVNITLTFMAASLGDIMFGTQVVLL